MKHTQEDFESKRQELLGKLQKIRSWVEGSLVSTARLCGKEACACHRGGSKHPVTFVTWKEDAKTISLYIPRKHEKDVKIWVDNYRKVKVLIREISNVQKQIIRLRD